MTLYVLHDAAGRIVAAAHQIGDQPMPRPVATEGTQLMALELPHDLREMPLHELCETHDIEALLRKCDMTAS